MSIDPTSEETKRDELRLKIEASERRIAERTIAEQAQDAARAATDYTRNNPLTVIGGALIVGVAIGMMTKPGRKLASTAASSAASAASDAASSVGEAASGAAKGVGDGIGKAAKARSNAIWALVADAIVGYGIKLIDDALGGAQAGQDAIEDIGDNAVTKAKSLRRDAGYIAGSAKDKAAAVTRRTRRRAERAVRDITDQARG